MLFQKVQKNIVTDNISLCSLDDYIPLHLQSLLRFWKLICFVSFFFNIFQVNLCVNRKIRTNLPVPLLYLYSALPDHFLNVGIFPGNQAKFGSGHFYVFPWNKPFYIAPKHGSVLFEISGEFICLYFDLLG